MKIDNLNISQVEKSIDEAQIWFANLEKVLSEKRIKLLNIY